MWTMMLFIDRLVGVARPNAPRGAQVVTPVHFRSQGIAGESEVGAFHAVVAQGGRNGLHSTWLSGRPLRKCLGTAAPPSGRDAPGCWCYDRDDPKRTFETRRNE